MRCDSGDIGVTQKPFLPHHWGRLGNRRLLGITERATHPVVSKLCEAGYLSKHRLGSRNFYEVHPEVALQQPLVAGHGVGELLSPLLEERDHKQDVA